VIQLRCTLLNLLFFSISWWWVCWGAHWAYFVNNIVRNLQIASRHTTEPNRKMSDDGDAVTTGWRDLTSAHLTHMPNYVINFALPHSKRVAHVIDCVSFKCKVFSNRCRFLYGVTQVLVSGSPYKVQNLEEVLGWYADEQMSARPLETRALVVINSNVWCVLWLTQ
jgi:hypothetical protein